MTIKILGPGCMNCRTLERRTLDALAEMNLQATVVKVTDLDGIASHGVMRTPGLVIDEKLIWQGGVPTIEKLKELIAKNVPADQ
jgi:small redox-active disulfide protein 2